ncbi:hypothetical protein OGATHE_003489 [Ogataea polymorpha]|uniref:Uncharacterized protein n=1 Tax=Ogataea polymorpha TaxID=460523 RepID=A0A9P8P441_9ASCO|nr:hypothetical protein OGATHE_003489 [Ogataea polymorpha]
MLDSSTVLETVVATNLDSGMSIYPFDLHICLRSLSRTGFFKFPCSFSGTSLSLSSAALAARSLEVIGLFLSASISDELMSFKPSLLAAWLRSALFGAALGSTTVIPKDLADA